jgi:glycine cleavage system aminomethyltransferase T
MTHASRRTPLHDAHVQARATLTDFAGWSMPLRYGSETSEHVAVRTAAGLFDLRHMGEIEVRGPAAASALDRALVSDIASMRVGKLVGLALSGRKPARAGYPVLDPGTGAPIGEVTSGGPSPTLGYPIAMAYIHTGQPVTGARVLLDLRATTGSASIVDLPFYRRTT